jgi:hypothetical protein
MDRIFAGIAIGIAGFFAIIALAFCIALLAAIPLYFLWNAFAPTYFPFLPAPWLAIPFWHVVCLTWLLSIVRGIIMPSAVANATAKND